MSKAQKLRALVSERLAAAAEDIFVLFERTIAEYEEELCRSKEKQRKQELYPKIELVQGNFLIPSCSPSSSLTQDFTQTTRIKEEPEELSVKLEEEQLPVPVPEFSVVCVETEEPSPLQQSQSEHREETQTEDISSETHEHSETEGITEHVLDPDDEDWEPPLVNQVPNRDRSTKPSTSLTTVQVTSPGLVCLDQLHDTVVSMDYTDIAFTGNKADRVEHQCPCCQKVFANKRNLLRHISVHTGEKPHSCSICHRRFTQKSNLDSHKRVHTGEKPYTCAFCGKAFARKNVLESHIRTHTESVFSCAVCHKVFSEQTSLDSHMSTHLLPDSDDDEEFL